MKPQAAEVPERLPQGGLAILTEFITHQDTITWSAVSVFITGELLLFAIWFQAPTASNAGRTAVVGILLTAASMFILKRSDAYLEKFYDLARERANEADKPIFNVKLEIVLFKHKGQPVKLPSAYMVLVFIHMLFFAWWIAFLAVYLKARFV
jgi:hypothetical protein